MKDIIQNYCLSLLKGKDFDEDIFDIAYNIIVNYCIDYLNCNEIPLKLYNVISESVYYKYLKLLDGDDIESYKAGDISLSFYSNHENIYIDLNKHLVNFRKVKW